MGLRFRQSFRLFPGVHLNLSKSGVSVSLGVAGATLNLGPQGVRSTVGVPGTGLSYRTQHSFSGGGSPASPDQDGLAPITPQHAPEVPPAYWQAPSMRDISSASVEELTSDSLRDLRDMIADARSQRQEIEADLAQARSLHQDQIDDLERRESSLFRFFYKRRIAELNVAIPETATEVERLESWLQATHVEIQFGTTDIAKKSYAALVRAFETLTGCASVWDVTSDRTTNRVVERTRASRALVRDPAVIEFSNSDLVQFEGRAMRFENVNGEDILIYPGMAIMPRVDGAFALIDLREMQLEFDAIQFHEQDAIPPDTKVVGETWAKTNKDGSPDRRFNGNYSIPVCLYGTLLFKSEGGVEEEYHFSNAEAAAYFRERFETYKAALSAE